MNTEITIFILDHIGVFFFAISGFLAAEDRNLDVFGGYIIAFITAFGGGTLRDILLNIDVAWMHSLSHVSVVIIGATVGLLFKSQLKKLRKTFFIFDTLGISFFTIVGVQKGLAHEQIAVTAVFLGMISATFGGLFRDVLCNEIPLIFRKEIYAIPCLTGAGFYIIGYYAGYGSTAWLLVSCIALIAIFRTCAVQYKWQMPLINEIKL
jgi:uncharacterized membrane protein YeiH